MEQKLVEQEKRRRRDERRKEVEKRDGLTREERRSRAAHAIDACGGTKDKECLKKLLGQEDAEDDDMIIL